MDAQTKVYELRAIEKELMALEERQAQLVRRRRRMLPAHAGLRVPAQPFASARQAPSTAPGAGHRQGCLDPPVCLFRALSVLLARQDGR